MNDERRRALNNIADKIRELSDELEGLFAEELEYYDNMPEAFQQSSRGEKSNEAALALSDALDSIEEVLDYIYTSIGW